MSPTRKMLINAADPEEFRVAILEEGLMVEFALEAASRAQTKGNIYKGVVANIEPSLQAAFVNYGGSRHGFLPLSEVHPDYHPEKGKEKGRPRIQQALRKGQEVVVQVVKEESATKGAYLTTYVSLPGRYLVLLVKQSHLGISRKIEKEEDRQRLKELAQKLGVPPEMGIIVRTVGAEGIKRNLAKDLSYLLKTWEEINVAAKQSAPRLLYKDLDVITRTVRDYLSDEVKSIIVDDKEVHQQLQGFLKVVAPAQVRALKHYQDRLPLFVRYQIEDQIERLYAARIPLKSGGSIVVSPTEALVAIDVNSGRCLGQKELEETAFKTNLEAAEEIARQLRLRDLGGLVVIDFIDMKDKKHIKEVEQNLRQSLKQDKARVTVGHISRFGLLELSRQRLRPAAEATTFIPCPACQGKGRVKEVTTRGLMLLRQIALQASQAHLQEVRGVLPEELANFLLNQKRQEIVDLESKFHIKIMLTAKAGLGPEEIQMEYLRLEAPPEAPAGKKSEPKESRRAKQPDESRTGKVPPPVSAQGHGSDG
ncbi:MAG: Rne/Rng family ribonuclease [Deltaproteobacteria bacterium]|nr:Rne/Rng family ribonuclease [Deltaproteobacteria bacterium]